MNILSIFHNVSNQIYQATISSGRLQYFLRKDSVFSRPSFSESSCGSVRNLTVPVSPGSGAGKGGGAGGSVRESGGALGQYGAANEDEFFYHKQKEQLQKIKSKQKKEPEKKTDK